MERFLGAQIAGTNEPVSHDIEAILPWLADPAIRQMLALQLRFWKMSESMGNHDSEVVDASSVD
jgi:hypothetical protein